MKSVSNAASRVVARFMEAKRQGVTMASTTQQGFKARELEINGELLTSYASCSYLGLELDDRLKDAAKASIDSAGTFFSTSRAYLQMGEYDHLEAKFEEIFGYPCIVSASTTLGHLSVMPALITGKDAVVIDYQAHNSLQDATILLKGKGIHREVVGHNDLLGLRERIIKLSSQFEVVWYVFDGVYSIYGDAAPFKFIQELLDEFPKLHLYCDDAHGMGWAGKYGSGYALSQLPMNDRMVLVTSLSKSVATGGGVIVLPNNELKTLVRVVGKTLVFSGPMAPSQLGAAIACCDILLSEELVMRQNYVQSLCQRFIRKAKELDLNLVDDTLTPIFYIGIGDYPTLFHVASRLRDDYGVFVTPTGYPAVPFSKCGLRITITYSHSEADIDHLLEGISDVYCDTLATQGISRQDMSKRFQGGVQAVMTS